MRVSNGWNTDYGKIKFDVSLDEDDIKRLLEEHGLPADTSLTVSEAFAILNNEGLSYAKFRLTVVEPDLRESLLKEIAGHRQNLTTVFDKVAAKQQKQVEAPDAE